MWDVAAVHGPLLKSYRCSPLVACAPLDFRLLPSAAPTSHVSLAPAGRWGRVSWKPWTLSLAIDLASVQLGATADRVSRVRWLALDELALSFCSSCETPMG